MIMLSIVYTNDNKINWKNELFNHNYQISCVVFRKWPDQDKDWTHCGEKLLK